MPLNTTAKSMCVLYALLISTSLASVALGQGYSETEPRQNRQFSGIVDQLSRGQAPVTSRRPALGESYQPLRSENRLGSENPSGQMESQLRIVDNGQDAVTLRPQPLSVRQASFEANDQHSGYFAAETAEIPSQQKFDQLHAEQQFQSFIERENAVPAEEKPSAADFITRIAVNLVFVLALAFAAILFVRQIQKGKANAKQELPAGLSGLKIDQTLQVTRGVSLYLVDSMASKILVAVDSGGIKSVNVLPSRFEDELEEPEAFSRQRDSEPTRSAATPAGRQASRRSLNKTSTSDIDENLIKLLLTKSREAA